MNSIELKITKMRNILDDLKNKNQRAIAQEEFLLKQLKDEFDVDSVEEGSELYDQLIEEQGNKQKKVANLTESLYNSLIEEGLIDATI